MLQKPISSEILSYRSRSAPLGPTMQRIFRAIVVAIVIMNSLSRTKALAGNHWTNIVRTYKKNSKERSGLVRHKEQVNTATRRPALRPAPHCLLAPVSRAQTVQGQTRSYRRWGTMASNYEETMSYGSEEQLMVLLLGLLLIIKGLRGAILAILFLVRT